MNILHASTSIQAVWGGPKRYIRLIIHDTTEELQMAATKYSGVDHDRTWACFQPCVQRQLVTKKETINLTKHYAGIMRLSMEHFDTHIIVHECVHAAAHIYRMDCRPKVNLGDNCLTNEEDFAFITGDIFNGVEIALRDAGYEYVWKED